jgi:hypothetical protein
MNSRTLHFLLAKACLLLLTGWAIYSFQRVSYYPYLLQVHPGTEFLNGLPEFVKNNLPSLLHVWAMALLTAVAMPRIFLRNPVLAPALWLSINIIFEWGQALDKDAEFLQHLPQALAHYFVQGRFDRLDIFACIMGACLALRTLRNHSTSFPKISWFRSKGLMTACTIFGLLSIMATSKHTPALSDPIPRPGQPIYMSYEEFRASFAVLPAQPIESPGKIYVKDHLLLINDINRGVHIVDNSNPAAPQPLSFLKVLGSRDIAVFGHYLYVDSFVDFLVIDMNDPHAPKLLQRVEDLFPWQPEVWFPGQWTYGDPKKGVIIGFEPMNASSNQEN